jgi:hypothetical protein
MGQKYENTVPPVSDGVDAKMTHEEVRNEHLS